MFRLHCQRSCRALIGSAVALLLAGVGGNLALSQPATPALFPLAPDPADCRVAARPLDDVVRVVGTPGPETLAEASPVPATPFALVGGEAADAETTREVEAALRQLFACVNAGDYLRVYALFTDDFVRDFFAGTPLTGDVIAFLAAPPRPLPVAEQRIIRAIGDVRLLPDGRAGVVMILDEPDDPRREEPDIVILRNVSGHWLVDEIHEDAASVSAMTDR
jgi:hypothetical protein